MNPHLADSDFTLYVGDVRDVLAELPAESVHCVVTSPPYWGLRDYGTGQWDGGNPDCDHAGPNPQRDTSGGLGGGRDLGTRGEQGSAQTVARPYRAVCGKCGARRVDRQLGLEPTPQEYVANMVAVFRQVRRVLRADGTLWLNLGDSYNSHGTMGPTSERSLPQKGMGFVKPGRVDGLKHKDLVGIPWRVAFALQQDGWYLRSDIIWAKPNPMPESVTDRPTKAHEYLFLLTKQPRYFFDQEAVREQSITNDPRRPYTSQGAKDLDGRSEWHSGERRNGDDFTGRNVRSVWEIATQPYPDAHFATFPEELPRRCIQAGTSEHGVCPECGAPWERIVEQPKAPYEDTRASWGDAKRDPTRKGVSETKLSGAKLQAWRDANPATTTGWRSACECVGSSYRGLLPNGKPVEASEPHEPVPATVLDPFAGSGTTCHVARKLGRRSIGIELNPVYAQLCAQRMSQLSLLT